MIFLKYDKATGNALGVRRQSEKAPDPIDSEEIGFLLIDGELNPPEWRVNQSTMQLEPRTKSHEELDTEHMLLLRSARDQKLGACDWRVMPDSPLTEAQRLLWVAYRTALRDIPQVVKRPLLSLDDVPWPEEPAS